MKPVFTPLAILLISISININISICDARILNVPEDYQTIQAGIDSSSDGDTVLVQPGVYEEHLAIAKPITVGSLILTTGQEEYMDSTIIDGLGEHRTVVTIGGDHRDTICVKGLVIANGKPTGDYGGGMALGGDSRKIISFCKFINDSAMVGGALSGGVEGDIIEHCLFEDNIAWVGAAYNREGDSEGPLFRYCIFRNNHADMGGAIRVAHFATLTVENCLFTGNTAIQYGGVFTGRDGASIDFINCTMVGNTAGDDGGVIAAYGGMSPHLTNCILYNNGEHPIWLFERSGWAHLYASYSLIEGGREAVLVTGRSEIDWLEGNLDENPLFVDADNHDYHIQEDSPCIDTGDPEASLDPDGTRADMGAFYFHQRDIVVSPDSIPFGLVFVGETVGQSLFLFNDGGTNLQIRTIDLTGGNFSFADDDRPYLIAPFTEHEILLFFSPEDTGDFNGAILVVSNDADEDTLIISLSGRGEWPNAAPSDTPQSAIFNLQSAYPNPFNGQTTIRFGLDKSSRTTIRIYGLSGRLVDAMDLGRIEAGEHSVVWNADGLPGGVYLIRLESGGESRTVKAVLIR